MQTWQNPHVAKINKILNKIIDKNPHISWDLLDDFGKINAILLDLDAETTTTK